MKKRVLVISDLHCGSAVGLTPPEYQWKIVKKDTAKHNKFAHLQNETWNWYFDNVKKLGKIDLLIVNGDMIDGSGYRSGGTEQLTTDKETQTEMAIECIDIIGAMRKVMTYGTPYHTGEGEDWESIIAKNTASKIGSHEWIDVNGVIFDCKHKIGSSGIVHGRHTAAAKERMWNIFWNEKQLTPKSNIFLRGHVHYYDFCGGHGWLAMTLPALQSMGTKYGSRQCSGLVDYGFVYFDVFENGTFVWHEVIADLQHQKAKVIKI